ncbi:IS5 family transposase [Gelidibacter salicanalis]|uniref:IS5 family transposase n=1 Tax=Gelidibacter salicanalis TaxID=291193 RepID=A0A934NDB5_9FLAO|nr:IS5 family transposase [Gelidibacter salicanalis]MBJ7881550.1 IS5 family transposase [Gelidibacter salicanalis]
MIKYTPASQLTLAGFEHPFERDLDPANRWVKMANIIPWDELATIYARNLDSKSGRQSVDIRLVIAALIIKHKLKLSDRETVSTISENIYIQYFCGYRAFKIEDPFDASLFVDIRKRMGADAFDSFNDVVIARAEELVNGRKRIMSGQAAKKDNGGQGEDGPSDPSDPNLPPNKGTLKLDATVCDQQIAYPTDIGLLSTGRGECERILDLLYKIAVEQNLYSGAKPRTYRRNARKDYLNISKKRNNSRKNIRKAIGKQIGYVERDIKHIENLLDLLGTRSTAWPLTKRDQRIYWVVRNICAQQKTMYENREHSHPDRITSVYQPYVRPMVRGKSKNKIEFGAKINASECNGMSKINSISWDAYNESTELKMQVEEFRKTYGRYPELLLADGIYMTRGNRKYMKEKGIRIVGKPLGRPPKVELSPYQKGKQRKERNQRNLIEGKFGQAKNGYNLNCIRARRKDTSESWIAAIFFVMNLITLGKVAEKYFFWLLKSLQHTTKWLSMITTVLFKCEKLMWQQKSRLEADKIRFLEFSRF